MTNPQHGLTQSNTHAIRILGDPEARADHDAAMNELNDLLDAVALGTRRLSADELALVVNAVAEGPNHGGKAGFM